MNSLCEQDNVGADGLSGGRRARKPLALLLVAAALLCAPLFLPVRDYLVALVEALRHFGAAGLAGVALLYIPACVLLLPGSVVTLGAGFLAALLWPDSPVFAVCMATCAASAGSTAGAAAAFLLGRTFFRDWVAATVERNPRFNVLDTLVGLNGFKMVFLLRLSPAFPFNLLNYALGATRVRPRDFIAASWIGMLPGTVLYVYLGATLSSLTLATQTDGTGAGPGGTALLIAGLAATALLVVWVTRIARQVFQKAVKQTAPKEDS